MKLHSLHQAAIILSGVSACSLLLWSCQVDDNYTYDKIRNVDTDMTLFQNGLQIPLVENTAQIRVDSIMKLAGLDTLENIVLQGDGTYRFELHDEFDLADQLDSLDLRDVVKISSLDHTENISSTLGIDASYTALLPSSGSVTLPNAALGIPVLSYRFNKLLNFNIMPAEDIPDMLLAVSEVNLDDVYITVDFTADNLPGTGTYTIDAVVDFPSFITPSQVNFEDIQLQNGVAVTRSVKIEKLDLSGFDFPQMKAEGTAIGGDITVNATATAESVTLDVNDVTRNVTARTRIRISDANGEIKAKNLSAKVDYQIDTTFNIAFISLPDAIKGATIELPDVDIDITSSTNLALPLSCGASIRSIGSTEDVATIEFGIPYSPDPAQTLSETTPNKVNINELLREMPDSVSFYAMMSTDTQRYCYVEPEADYKFKLEYSLSAPLQLGENSIIPYSDTIKFGSDAGQILGKVLKENKVQLSGDVDNGIPLSLSVVFSFLSYDEASGIYTDIPLSKEVSTELLKAGSQSSFSIELGPDSNPDIGKITHMKLHLEIGSNGSALEAGQSVKISNIALTLPEGLTADPKDYINSDDNNE